MKKMVLMVSILLLAGCGNDEVKVNGEIMHFEQLEAEILLSESKLEEINKNIEVKEKELADLQKTLEANADKYEGLEELSKNRDGVTSMVKESEKKLGLLEVDIEEAQVQLDKLKGDIVKVKEEPVKVGAGSFYFGEDIKPGRYKAVAQEGYRGIMFVRASGDLGSKASSALGSEDGNKDYVFEAVTGDELETTMPIYLYPVE